MSSEGKPASKKSSHARRRAQAEASSRGLSPAQVAAGGPPAKVGALRTSIEADGGTILGTYRDPLGGHWQILAALPLDKVRPTPFQRDLSEAHAERLSGVIEKMDRFLDPIIAVRTEDAAYWTPNGHHRTAAMKRLGARSIVALVLPDAAVAYQILALNTEKAHNLREKSLEVIRMARSLSDLDPRPEKEFFLEFEEAAFLTLGLCYEKRGRFSGGAYHPVLKRVDAFLGSALPRALETRGERAAQVLELDDAVVAAVAALKERGLTSPYLKAFVVARVNPLRFQRGAKAGFDETIGKCSPPPDGSTPRRSAPTILPRRAGRRRSEPRMRIASWNVNSLRVRLPHLLDWLKQASPDVVCLQETKVVDADFPGEELAAAGYSAVFAGEKTYNGVAILARGPLSGVTVGLPGDGATAQRRLIAATTGGTRVVNVYVPNGSEVGSDKYAYKLEWLDRLDRWLRAALDPASPLVLCGDFNIAPEDRDVYDADALRGTIMFSDDEKDSLHRLLSWGLTDTLRLHSKDSGLYSWWDYRAGAFRRNLGWRIDLILATASLARVCARSWIDVAPRRLDRPSDHAPVLSEFSLSA